MNNFNPMGPLRLFQQRVKGRLINRFVNGVVKYNDVRNVMTGKRKMVPAELLWVDPDLISRSITWNKLRERDHLPEYEYFDKPKYKIAATIRGGDWDSVRRRFEDSTVYTSFVEHFENDAPWEDTVLYNEAIDRIRDGERWWRCTTEAQFRDRCRELDQLFNTIRKDGYKTQRNLLARDDVWIQSRGAKNASDFQILKCEVAVNIGRNGELIFHDGRNRLAMAKILGLEEIPVVVLVRHEGWQRLRDEIVMGKRKQSDLSEVIRSHPDLPQNVPTNS